jgi:FkbM family methyltransferase
MMATIKNILKKYLSRRGHITVISGFNRGLKFHFNSAIFPAMIWGSYEKRTFQIIDYIVKKSFVTADLGANIGYISAFLSKKVGKDGKVYAFEPVPATVEVLLKNINVNSLTNVQTVAKAVSDKNSFLTLYLGISHYESSLVRAYAGEKYGSIEVETVTLDSFFDNDTIDFIKVDIEGGGVLAALGMKACLKKHQPILLLEGHNREEDMAFAALLKTEAYKCFRMNNPHPILNFEASNEDKNGFYGLVLAIPESKLHNYPNIETELVEKLSVK